MTESEMDALPDDVLARMARNGFQAISDRVDLSLIASSTGDWLPTVSDAFERRDSVPLLAFADWLDENGHEEHSGRVREIAARLADPNFTPPPASPP